MVNKLIIILMPFVLQLCTSIPVIIEETPLPRGPLPVSQEQYLKDKDQIANYILNNVDYYRLTPEETYMRDYPDNANFFTPYASYFDSTFTLKTIPIPASHYLSIEIDTIFYNSSGLKCFIFCGIRINITLIHDMMRAFNRNCDAYAFIGIRNNITDSLSIYPFDKYFIFGYGDMQEATHDLEFLYNYRLKGDGYSSDLDNKVFEQNVRDRDFFEKSIIFRRYDDSTFHYQHNVTSDDIFKYPYMK